MKILKEQNIEDFIFIDIETASIEENLTEGSELYKSWEYKMRHGRDSEEGDLDSLFKEKSTLYPEFSKIITIVIGIVRNNQLHLKAFADKDEKDLLENFNTSIMNILASNPKSRLVGHAIKIYDIPFIMTRCILNKVPLNPLIDTAHLKPWELTCIDTHELWKSTSLRGASLINITVALGLPSPKDDMAGYETTNTYYNDPNGLHKIVNYCKKDVIATAHVINACRYEPYLEVSDVKHEEKSVGTLEQLYNTKLTSDKQDKFILETYNKLTNKEKEIADELIKIATYDK